MKIESNLQPKNYSPNEVCRIVNMRQAMLYVKSGLYPIDMYTSIDSKTGNDILVMIFDKEASYPLYQAWCTHELE